MKFFTLISIILLFNAIPTPLLATGKNDLSKIEQTGPWMLRADRITYDKKTGSYKAEGNVRLERPHMSLKAGHLLFDPIANIIIAWNEVILIYRGDRVEAERIEIDLEAKKGTIEQGFIFIKKTNFSIKGKHINKTGPSTYIINEATLTSCDPDKPDWSISGRVLKITVEGYASVENGYFYIKNIPVIYVPYGLFPAKRKRSSGFLLPRPSISSRNGFSLEVPYFWAFSRNSDTTFYFDYLSKRGEKAGIEFRYLYSPLSKGLFFAQGINDKHIDDGTGDASDNWGYTQDEYIRTNHHRYWICAKADHALPGNWSASIDIDIVSDQDYIEEFESFYTGYGTIQKRMSAWFGRDIDDANDNTRRNRLNIHNAWNNAILDADLIYDDNAALRQNNLDDTTLQRLPVIRASAIKQPVFDLPLYWSADTSYEYLYSKDGNKGHRVDFRPEISIPYRVSQSLCITPYAAVRQTFWITDSNETYAENVKNSTSRTIYETGVHAQTEIYKIYATSSGGLLHSIIPEIEYRYIPKTEQEKIPYFDPMDRIDEESRLIFSITQLFTSKTFSSQKDILTSGNYNQFCRIYVAQPFSFKDTNGPSHGFEPLTGELEIHITPWVAVKADASFDHAVNRLDFADLSINLETRDSGKLNIDYRYMQDDLETIAMDTSIPLNNYIHILCGYEYNIRDSKTLEWNVALSYDASCWRTRLSLSRDETDRRIGFIVDLKGLGGMGE